MVSETCRGTLPEVTPIFTGRVDVLFTSVKPLKLTLKVILPVPLTVTRGPVSVTDGWYPIKVWPLVTENEPIKFIKGIDPLKSWKSSIDAIVESFINVTLNGNGVVVGVTVFVGVGVGVGVLVGVSVIVDVGVGVLVVVSVIVGVTDAVGVTVWVTVWVGVGVGVPVWVGVGVGVGVIPHTFVVLLITVNPLIGPEYEKVFSTHQMCFSCPGEICDW